MTEATSAHPLACEAWQPVLAGWLMADLPPDSEAALAAHLSECAVCRAEAESLLRDVVRSWRAADAETDVAEARRELARALARQGDHGAALDLLAEARATQLDHGQAVEVLITDLRTAEAMLLAGRGEEALALADDIETRAAATDGGPLLTTGVARVRGWGLLQRGERAAAAEQFRSAIQLAVERGDDFQTTLALDGLLTALDDEDPERTSVAAWRDAMVNRLGIGRTPPVPVEG